MVPLILSEDTSDAARALLRGDPEMLVWWGTEVEVSSAIARLERLGQLDSANTILAWDQLNLLAGAWQEVEPSGLVRDLARQLLRRHKLRAPDSLQLASAVLASPPDGPRGSFVSLDDDLTTAARAEGFTVFAGDNFESWLAPTESTAAETPTASIRPDTERTDGGQS